MIAGRAVVLIVGYDLPPIVRAEIERAGALIIDVGQRDPALVTCHVQHALLYPPPIPATTETMARDPKAARRPAGPRSAGAIACRKCGAATEISPGRGPHAARANCRCGAWRWVSKAELHRADADAARVGPVDRGGPGGAL